MRRIADRHHVGRSKGVRIALGVKDIVQDTKTTFGEIISPGSNRGPDVVRTASDDEKNRVRRIGPVRYQLVGSLSHGVFAGSEE